jgi:dTDP-4-dehydrorhamnose reductase
MADIATVQSMDTHRDRTVWVTGAAGLIGGELVKTAPAGIRVVALTRHEVDLTDSESVRAAMLRDRPSLILHSAALSKPSDCQSDPALARRVNVEATRRLCALAGDAPVWFLSTDLVFDGRKGGYSEEDPVSPVNVYGDTKVEAEDAVLQNPRNAVFRLSMNGGVSARGDRGFNEEFRLSLDQGRPLSLFKDEFRCPIAASWTARTLWSLVGLPDVGGIFHLCGGQKLSRFEIGQILVRRWGRDESQLVAGSVHGYQGPPRSPDTSMITAKLEALMGIRFPGLREWLDQNPGVSF